MSSVSNVGQADISQLLQKLQSGSKSGKANGGFSTQQPPAEVRQQFEAKFQSAAKELGIDGSKFAEVGGKIRDTVQSTVENNQGLSQEELQGKIDESVNSVLKDNGIDPEEFKSQLKQIGEKAGFPDPSKGGFGGAGGVGGFKGFGGASNASGTYSQKGVDSNTQLLQQLISSLGGDDSGASSFFGNAQNGSFVDVAA